jgi:hypothetical protein
MRRLLQQYAKNPSDANARRVAKYVKDHPFSGMLLDAEHWVIMRNAADHMVRLRNQSQQQQRAVEIDRSYFGIDS